MRLIDADKILEAIANSGMVWETNECLDVIEVLAVKKIIDEAPTITIKDMKDELPDYIKRAVVDSFRPKGKWIHSYDDFYKCSLCGRGICTDWETEPAKHFPFCHCGADMRSVDEGLHARAMSDLSKAVDDAYKKARGDV